MKKKLIASLVLSVACLTACGNTMSPSEAAAKGVAPVADTTAEQGADVQEESNEVADAEETAETAEVVLNADPSKAANGEGISLDDLAVKAGTVTIKIDEDFLPNVDKVGEAEIVEGQACLEGGYDTNYYYGGEELVVYTLAKSGQQVVYDIYVSGNQYATAKGATVGTSTKEDVEGMYGEPSSMVGNSYVYDINGGEIQAQFEFDNSDVLMTIDILKK